MQAILSTAKNGAHAPAGLAPFAGPYLLEPTWLRYVAAAAIAIGITGIRVALTPALGAHAPLLPALAAVLLAVVVSGRGPSRCAIALAAAVMTAAVHPWPTNLELARWAGHLLLFIALGTLLTEGVHALQVLQRRQLASLRVARAAESNAQAAAARLRLIADSVPVLISYVDNHHRYGFNNRRYEEWFGLQPPDISGKHLREVLGDAAYAALEPRILQALTGQAVHFEAEVPYRSGGTRHVNVHYVPDFDGDATVRGFFALVEDITERIKANALLRDTERRKNEFLAMLSHEMRNPLAAITNASALLVQPALQTGKVRSLAELLERQTAQLTRIIDDLLDVERVSHGTVKLRKQIIPIDSAIDAALETLKSQLDERHQRVEVIRPSQTALVDADPVRLCQVFGNLLSNASRYSAQHTLITAIIEARGDHIFVHVRDEGRGIDAHLLPLVFDLFTQGERDLARREGGLGIGLTMVKHLVQMHGGNVEARSAGRDQGSEFTVCLPRWSRPVPPPVRAAALGEAAVLPKRILVVDDNVDAAHTLALLFKSHGHGVLVCHDGTQALQALNTYAAQVVVLDIGLPGMDGYELAKAIRARPGSANALLIAVTGYGDAEAREQARQAGFDHHLTKPVDIDALLESVDGSRTARPCGWRDTDSHSQPSC